MIKVFIKTSGAVRLIFICVGRVSLLDFGEGIHQWHSHQTEGSRYILVREIYDYAEIPKGAKKCSSVAEVATVPWQSCWVLGDRTFNPPTYIKTAIAYLRGILIQVFIQLWNPEIL